MKFKMAKNSLFAVLLRSPWWVSMLLVAAFSLVSVAMLPRPYVPFGVMGALPFLVIGLVAAKRQWGQPSAAQVEDTLAQAVALSAREFSDKLAASYTAQGFAVTRLHQQAADLQLVKAGFTTLVACKRWKAASHGTESLRELAAAPGADQRIYVSVVPVTDKAQAFAQAQGIGLLAGPELANLLDKSLQK
jgi:restriction system protein